VGETPWRFKSSHPHGQFRRSLRPIRAQTSDVSAFTTRDVAIYAAIIGTLDGAWSIYRGIVLDRPRVVVQAVHGEAISTGTGHSQPILWLSVSNRGRRTVYVSAIARTKSMWSGVQEMSQDIIHQLTPETRRLEESQSQNFAHRERGGYQHGDLSLKRWFVQDGAGRIRPLRERYRQRAERIILWPLRRFFRWRDSSS
jgi:hypothetical protein